jgi:GST-like protein
MKAREGTMIDIYMAGTTNSRRASIGLCEAGLPYRSHAMNLRNGDQKSPAHLARNPYGKVPVIVDSEGPSGKSVTIFESGAILLYLAEKTGKLYGADPLDRIEVQKWFMLHMSGPVPLMSALKSQPGLRADCERVMKVIDTHLAEKQFFADAFSIADIALYPRIAGYDPELLDMDIYPNVQRWIAEVGARPAVQAGMQEPRA